MSFREHQVKEAIRIERERCADIAFQSVWEKTGSAGCAAQVRHDVLHDSVRGEKRSLAHIAELYEKAKAVDDSLRA